ncbi:pimeloyl-ACP methyl ester carboxylesterase [Amycolatopsis lexingtonensis]|uniref:Pimeloyl-ACP methyl ester carboxylesterase n=1 Tax=Amycolatopsis lexingtonensis TaxID=218822 RepID=A0ABR9IF66_9PSEU|nr:alpha/beta hydrolase [Amycolatopsis lexingtonensis]MBE1501825.1 pimeloyl-ACP methyl ester carboxylesterase [Amycolatopsis lexingtonensis]
MTVVLVHGLEGSRQDWTEISELLAPDFRLVAPDLPWQAGNDYTWRAGGTPGQWLDRALSAVPGPIDAVVGHSFGANATLELLSTGRRFERVALLAPLYQPAGLPVDESLRQETREALASAVRTGLRLKLRSRALRPDLVGDMQRKLVDHVLPRAFPSFFEYLCATRELDLSGVDTRTLVLAGTRDVSLPPAGARALGEAMPAASIRLRGHYTHFCHQEQAAEVATELAEFLRVPVGRE